MKYLIIMLLITVPCAKAEGLYLTLGVGWNDQFLAGGNSDWNDGGGTGAFIALSYQWEKQAWCFNCRPSLNYAHISQWDVGCPQDCDDDEDWIEHIGFAGTWALFER